MNSADENPYKQPVACVEASHIDQPPVQHRRPLWIGLTLSALVPVSLPVVYLLVASVFDPGALFIALVVGFIGLIISSVATVTFALPLVLILRRYGHPNAILVCSAAALVGALAMGYAAVDLNWYSQLPDNTEAIRKGIGAMIPGAFFGLLSGLAMSLGSGIPFTFRKASRRPN